MTYQKALDTVTGLSLGKAQDFTGVIYEVSRTEVDDLA